VKTAFLDTDVRARLMISSANSINISRLVPQSFYYCWAWSRLTDRSRPVVITVPSGNFGNLTGGLIAKRMGLPGSHFIAATNVNDSVPAFLETGVWREKPAVATISNAMDVSRPSNWERVVDLYGGDREATRQDIAGYAFDDALTRAAIRDLHRWFGYVADPHGAVDWQGLEKYRDLSRNQAGIFLKTAHPAKFPEIVEKETGASGGIPKRAHEFLKGPRHVIKIGAGFSAFKEYLLAH
jgi:threonine synthase